MESLEGFIADASRVDSFGDIPLLVISANHPERSAGFYQNEQLREEMDRLWLELQTDMLSLSSNSRQVFHMMFLNSMSSLQKDQYLVLYLRRDQDAPQLGLLYDSRCRSLRAGNMPSIHHAMLLQGWITVDITLGFLV